MLTRILFILILKICLVHLAKVTTLTRIQNDGYIAEEHKIQTSDGYILKVFRLPNGKVPLTEPTNRPLALVVHGLLSSSDSWVINGPDEALAYTLADAGYDVWLANCRGNTYSHTHAKYSSFMPQFWHFNWHEMGIYDLPAIIDYMLYKTNQTELHYVGHSQGTTALLVLLSMIPAYNLKIKSAQLLAPVVFMPHMKSPMARVFAPLLGQPNILAGLVGSMEFLPSNAAMRLLGSELCKDTSTLQDICMNTLFLLCGFDSELMNKTLLPEVAKTHPAGSSVDQIIHYLQEFRSKKYRQYDYGMFRNLFVYKSKSPPEYNLKNVIAPIYLYYGDNDWLAAVEDVQNLLNNLSNVKMAYRMPHEKWNHLDFLWAINVRKSLYEIVLKNMKNEN